MSIRILKAGILDTVQDMGRAGVGKWGINPSGAMDWYAARVANMLVGNDPEEGAIEIHFPSSQFLFLQDALISICGADFTPVADETPVSVWKTVWVKKNSVLTFRNNQWGIRCYLAVHGGFDLPRWLGSLSTNLKASAGGMNGGALKKNDVLHLRAGKYEQTDRHESNTVFPWKANVQSAYNTPSTIFFIEGNEWSWLTMSSQEALLSEGLSIHPSSDRMAAMLHHSPLQFQQRQELLSSGVSFGTMQALPSGKVIVLMADHQTTGGYPRIGHIITAHLPKFSQLRPGENFHLRKISVEDAEKMVFSLQHDLEVLQETCREKLELRYAQH
jgi:antagonist of KipI